MDHREFEGLHPYPSYHRRTEGHMQNRFMLVSTCVMVLSSAGCHQARPVTAVVPQSVETALRRALQPLPQQSIRIEEDSAPRVFPNRLLKNLAYILA